MANVIAFVVFIIIGSLLLWLAHWCQTHIIVPLEPPEKGRDTFRDGDYEGPARRGHVPSTQGPTLQDDLAQGPEPGDPWHHETAGPLNALRVGIGAIAAYIGLMLVLSAILGSIG